jgi:phosphatidylinositol-binding clathrin assembly protein
MMTSYLTPPQLLLHASPNMSNSFEKSVKGGTKVKAAPPKSKYVEHILLATQSGEAGVAEVFRTLTHRLRDSTWTVAFKSLIIVHLMIKEGARDVTLSYLSTSPKAKLAINHFSDVQTQGQNIIRYSEYLLTRAEAYGASKTDYVRNGEGRVKGLTVNKGLLRETEVIQKQVGALVKCDFLSTDVENEISLTAFRLLTRDLLDLYNVQNEAVMNVLSHYFEMSKPDAERAIKIYKRFCRQTDEVVKYLNVAKQYEHATRLEIPKIKHAPTSLAQSLQEYLEDKDFEINRRQYLAEQEAKRTGKPIQKPAQTQAKAQPTSSTATTTSKPAEPAASSHPAKGPAPDLIDFFASIEQNQQPMAQSAPQFPQQSTAFPQQQQQPFPFQQQQQQPPQQTGFQQAQPNGFQPSGTNPFAQMQQQQQQQQPQPLNTQFTGAGFGGYGPQPQQQFVGGNAFDQNQQQYASPVQMQSPQQQQPQTTNPFRQSMMPTGASSMSFGSMNGQNLQRQATNPFARNTSTPPVAGSPFAQQPPQAFPPQQQQSPSPFQPQSQSPFAAQQPQQPQAIQPQPTGTNPFARNITPQQTAPVNTLQVQPTGSTNPFRQSAFVNQQTGSGWQHAPQATMGGLESLETIPVFPRPGQAPNNQQQSPWGVG